MSLKATLINDPKNVFEIDRKYTKFELTYVPNTPLGANYQPCSTVLPEKFGHVFKQIRKFEVRPDDIFLGGPPKCGTTWAQEMVWLINNDLNYEEAKSKNLYYERFLGLENDALVTTSESDILEMKETNLEKLAKTPSPRHIKCHLALPFLPDNFWDVKPKFIYVIRNPKDAAISFYHHSKNIRGFKGTLEDYLYLYLSDQALSSPYFGHVMGYWQLRDQPNLLILTYEDMKKDLKAVIRQVAKFLDKQLTSEQVDELFNHLQVDSMRKNKQVNFEDRIKKAAVQSDFQFIRKGQMDAYKDEMPQEWIDKFDEAIRDRMPGCDLYK